MGNLFSSNKKKPKSKISTYDKAILDLKLQRDKLKQYQKKIQLVLDRETEIAKIHLRAGYKQKALLALKKKKYQQQLLEKTDGQLQNLEQMTSTMEYSLIEQQVLNGLKAGNEVLAEIQKEMSLDDVEKLMQDTADAIAYQNEISELLGGKLSEEDEEGLLEELAAIQSEQIGQKLPEVPAQSLPVPVAEGSTNQESDIEEEIEEEVEDQAEGKREMIPA